VSWKNVLRLYGVYSKSYRLIARGKFRNYRDSRWKSPSFRFFYLLLSVAGLEALAQAFSPPPYLRWWVAT
jgi:hypothetical protein